MAESEVVMRIWVRRWAWPVVYFFGAIHVLSGERLPFWIPNWCIGKRLTKWD